MGRFIFYQLFIFSAAITTNYFIDDYLGPPFTWIDLVAAAVALLIFGTLFPLLLKLYQREDASLPIKLTLSAITFLIAAISTSFLLSLGGWY
ncbi:hypothetical protein LCM20_15825 [Halobacillus litoralis]|uniref:hypothetical protein n=1 Tax=Halobacillus litoralis TaxID=45668 RepID=UPI001CD1E120|nr:hypothetical protein [Halobacillus litoralis]MCA0972076.1 hypothetical protein [Halobacillus litoralis]